jgi:hypothetical protein
MAPSSHLDDYHVALRSSPDNCAWSAQTLGVTHKWPAVTVLIIRCGPVDLH